MVAIGTRIGGSGVLGRFGVAATLLVVSVTTSTTSGPSINQSAPTAAYALSQSELFAISGGDAATSYRISVALPSNYASSPGTFPVVYVLDGDWYFALAASLSRLVSVVDKVPPAIVVAIGYGGTIDEQRRRRIREFTPKAEESLLDSGHATEFLRALRERIIPAIDSRYRTTTERVLVGHSLGGLFALFAMRHAPGLFGHMVIGSPALWSSRDGIVADLARALKQRESLPESVFFGVASGDTPSIREAYAQLVDVFRQSASPVRWKNVDFPETTHQSSVASLLATGVPWALSRAPK